MKAKLISMILAGFILLTACTVPAMTETIPAQPTIDTLPTYIPQANMPNSASVYCEQQGYPALSALLLATVLAAGSADTLVVGTLADPGRLAPHQATDIVAAEIVSSACDTLVRVRPGSLRHEGVLATAWASLDQRVWTLTLRPNVRFHDGAVFDADAVDDNLEHLRLERGFPGRAERLGPHLVQITLDRPNAALLSTLSQPFFAMQSPRRLEGPGSQTPLGKAVQLIRDGN